MSCSRIWLRAIVPLGILALFLVPAAASATLASVGPLHPSNGYPVYYQDTTGLALEQCLDPLDPLCGALVVPDPLSPVSFPDNFPDEFFYWNGTATMPTNGGGSALLVLALEGAFGTPTGTVAPDQQIVFGRIRIRIDNLVAGATYTITHPYGVETMVADAAGPRGINFTEDLGCLQAPCDFARALTGRIGPFLVWDPAESAPPAGYVGDPAVDHSVLGSPLGTNFFRVEGPDVGGPGINVIQTNLFAVQGKIFTGVVPSPLAVDRATYSRVSNAPDPATGQIVVFATSVGTASLEVSGSGLLSQTMVQDPSTPGKFFAVMPSTTPTLFPSSITVTNFTDSPPTPVTHPLVDEVTISKAEWDAGTFTLNVQATSSDQLVPPVLTAVGFGALDVDGNLAAGSVVIPPPTVTVTSAAGGSDTEPVSVVGVSAPAGNLPPVAFDDTASDTQDQAVTLSVLTNDTDPEGALDPTTVAIVTAPANGTAVAQPDGTVLYTPNAGFVGTDTFTYTVDDAEGLTSNVATVSVNVTPLDMLAFTRVEYRTGKAEWRIDGTATVTTGNAVTIYAGPTVGGSVIGVAPVDAAGVWTFRETNSPTPVVNEISIQSTAGGIVEGVAVSIRN